MKKKLLDVPIFLVCSANDEVISETMSLNYFSLQPNPLSRMLYYTPKLFENEDPRIIQISSAIPEKNIISFSHVCLPIAPEHPHYGENGDFNDHQHYSRMYGPSVNRKNEDEVTFGAVSRENLRKYNFKRLNFNPDFHNMLYFLEEFLNKIQRKF